jgi:hypothetical protein
VTFSPRATAPAGRAEAGCRKPWAKTTRFNPTFDVEILPRIRFAESLAFRTALGLDPGVTKDKALVAIGQTLHAAERWAVAL